MLRSTQLPVQAIDVTAGYSSRRHFSRAFRAAYGEDPKSFRERARSGSGSEAAEPPVNHAARSS